jgi:RNA polymerase sigma factor (sigma-70 family)
MKEEKGNDSHAADVRYADTLPATEPDLSPHGRPTFPLPVPLRKSKEELIALGRQSARRRGVPRDEWDDCAMEVILQYLTWVPSTIPAGYRPRSEPVHLDRTSVCQPQLGRLADKVVHNYTRRLQTYRTFVAPAPGEGEEGRPSPLERVPDSAPTPEETAMCAEAMGLVHDALATLKPLDRKLFLARYVDGESLSLLAQRYLKSENAIALRLHRSRERLQAFVTTAGWSEAELRSSIVVSAVSKAELARLRYLFAEGDGDC